MPSSEAKARMPSGASLSPHDDMHSTRLHFVVVGWLWRASFTGYNRNDREWGFAFTRARAEGNARQAIDEMRYLATD